MNELPYFYFVVMAAPQLWPYYVEIPYVAWPDETMYYNSNGTCRQPYDRAWSYLDVMNWETHENIIICDAKGLVQTDQARQALEKELDIWSSDDSFLSLAHICRLLMHLLDAIPQEHCEPGNVVVSSFRCGGPQLVAVVARLFMQRLQSDIAWDGQTGDLLTLGQLEKLYLEDFALESRDRLANEARRVFSEGEAWHRVHPDVQIGWWKTISQVREAIRS